MVEGDEGLSPSGQAHHRDQRDKAEAYWIGNVKVNDASRPPKQRSHGLFDEGMWIDDDALDSTSAERLTEVVHVGRHTSHSSTSARHDQGDD